MSTHFSLLFLLFTTVALTTTTTSLHHLSSITSPSPAPSPPQSQSQSQSQSMQQQQLKNILDALIGAGDFAAWANILFNPTPNTSTIPTTLPTTATFFVPGNAALSRLSATATGAYSFDPFIIPYHVLPQRLTFSDLQLFKQLTRIQTLLPAKTILITDNSPSHFTIDGELITHPDIYSNAAVCVHGIDGILDYRVYGEQTPPAFVAPMPPLPPADETVVMAPVEVVSSVGGGLFLIRFVGVGLLLVVTCSWLK